GIPKAILSDPATVERVVLGQTIAERFPDGPRVEKRERILLSVELIGDKLAVDARVLDAEVDLAQVNVFTAEPGFEASNSLFCIVKRLRRRSGNPRFHQIGGRETLCCRVDSDVNGRRHDTQSCPAVRWVTELAPLITHGLNVYIASGTRGTGSLSGCRLEGLERAIDLCRSSYPNRQGEHSCGASFPQAASPSAPKGALSSPWKTPPIHSRSLTEQAAAGGESKDLLAYGSNASSGHIWGRRPSDPREILRLRTRHHRVLRLRMTRGSPGCFVSERRATTEPQPCNPVHRCI